MTKNKQEESLNTKGDIFEIMAELDTKLFVVIIFSLSCATFLAYKQADNEIIIAIIGLASNIVTYHITKQTSNGRK